jgi:hypothetical protein
MVGKTYGFWPPWPTRGLWGMYVIADLWGFLPKSLSTGWWNDSAMAFEEKYGDGKGSWVRYEEMIGGK